MTLTGETRERLLVCTAALGRRRARQESSEVRKKFRSRFSVRFFNFYFSVGTSCTTRHWSDLGLEYCSVVHN